VIERGRIAVFASGSGSNYEAIVRAFTTGSTEKEALAEVVLLVCDKPDAYVLERAKRWGTPAVVLSPRDFDNKAQYEEQVLTHLREYGVEYIVLAGYMRLIGPTLLQPYIGRVINFHPSLLPAFPGLDAVGQALDYGVRLTGVTVHFVDEGMDTGPVIAQRAVEVHAEDTHERLQRKIQRVEHELYPEVVRDWVGGRFQLKGGKVTWAQPLKEH
jgi:phosphoribosylglycinamide formyltransferase 1